MSLLWIAVRKLIIVMWLVDTPNGGTT